MRYIEAISSEVIGPEETAIFLAGGITGCRDWQQELRSLLSDTQLTLVNPRRPDFPIGDPGAAQEQITWEYWRLLTADAISFWFTSETIQPIVLFELGRWSAPPTGGRRVPIFVGAHPDYIRRQDVVCQLALSRPEVKVVASLAALAEQITDSFPGR